MPTTPSRFVSTLHQFALRYLLPAVVINTVIALGITVFGSEGFATNWVYSQCIGLGIGALIQAGIRGWIRDWDTQWRRIAVIVPLAAGAGFLVGVALADQLLGLHSMHYWQQEPRKAWGYLALSLVAGMVITYYFASRAQLAHVRQRAEVALRQATEAQLQLLQSQLEPHMLFNTLANLRVLIGLDPPRAQHMLDHLVGYLRATLDASRRTEHTLQQEFDRLRDYLELMAVRMGPRLHYRLQLPPALASQPVPPLLLQALVENSIQHALEPKVEGGSVCIAATQEGGLLVLEVTDTGVGSTVDLNHLGDSPEHFGLSQVRARLHTRYGHSGALIFIATLAGGTRARVQFPLQP